MHALQLLCERKNRIIKVYEKVKATEKNIRVNYSITQIVTSPALTFLF
jgi:hypothetical protein